MLEGLEVLQEIQVLQVVWGLQGGGGDQGGAALEVPGEELAGGHAGPAEDKDAGDPLQYLACLWPGP